MVHLFFCARQTKRIVKENQIKKKTNNRQIKNCGKKIRRKHDVALCFSCLILGTVLPVHVSSICRRPQTSKSKSELAGLRVTWQHKDQCVYMRTLHLFCLH